MYDEKLCDEALTAIDEALGHAMGQTAQGVISCERLTQLGAARAVVEDCGRRAYRCGLNQRMKAQDHIEGIERAIRAAIDDGSVDSGALHVALDATMSHR